MKCLSQYCTMICVFFVVQYCFGQNIIEIQKQEFTKIYLETIKKEEEIGAENPKEAIQLLETVLDSKIKPFEEFEIVCFRLPFLYARQKEYDKFFKLWTDAQEKEYFFPFRTGDRPFPEFLNKIKDKQQLQSLLNKNDDLRKTYGTKTNVEYFVQTPKNYSEKKKYPLIITLHGGWGSHTSTMKHYQSPLIESEYIVAYTQGSVVRGTFLHSYDNENGLKNIQSVYKQVVKKYSVDTTRIILGSPSAGGMRSVQLSMDNLIPAKGLILAFPIKPRDLESGKVMDMAMRGVRVSIIGGESDWGLRGHKEMAVIFDKLGVENRLIIFPQIGHEYPDQFTEQIDQSLNFILRK